MKTKDILLLLFVSVGILSCHGQLQTNETPESRPYKDYLKNYRFWYGKDPANIARNKAGENIRAIFQNRKGVFWLGTASNGICRYDGNTFKYYSVGDGLPANQINTITEDTEGNLWIATSKGLYKYDGKTFLTINSLENQWISSVLVDKQGTVWIATEKWFGPLEHNEFRGIFGLDAVTCIYQTSKGQILIGTKKIGVYAFDIINSLPLFTNTENLPQNISQITEDKKGNIWIGTLNSGLWSYDGKNLDSFSTKNGISSKEIKTVLEDKAGAIWFSSEGKEVYSFDGKNLKKYGEGLTIKTILTLLEDKDGILWIGGIGGLSRFDGKNFQNIALGFLEDGC